MGRSLFERFFERELSSLSRAPPAPPLLPPPSPPTMGGLLAPLAAVSASIGRALGVSPQAVSSTLA